MPIVEELISQVRARQHEFNNRMMAIEAVVTSADTIEEARKEVTALTGSIGISLNDRELLSCDSKMIAGMLFGKIKQAEAANRHIELSLHGLFKKTVTPETEWIEAIGILLDNAIEASPKGSTVFLSSKKQGDFLELTVANLRHTFATHALSSGVDAKTLAGILGHTKASFTLDTYTHTTGDMQKRAAEIVGGFLTDYLGEEMNPWQSRENMAAAPSV